MNPRKFFYILVYGMFLLVVGAGVSGCQEDFQITPEIRDTRLETSTEPAFVGVVDGQTSYMLDSLFTCVDSQIIVRAPVIDSVTGLTVHPVTGSVLLDDAGTPVPAVDDQGRLIMVDGVIDTCDPELKIVTETVNTVTPIFSR